MTRTGTQGFTGRHMTGIMIAFFAVVITVNVMMAQLAIGTFGGQVVENSYVASQHFNRWLDEAARERALGWQAEASRREDGRLMVRLLPLPTAPVVLKGFARHPLGRLPDRPLQFVPTPDGTFVSTAILPAGRWQVHLEFRANGRKWRHEENVL